jgi:hypothetical protein
MNVLPGHVVAQQISVRPTDPYEGFAPILCDIDVRALARTFAIPRRALRLRVFRSCPLITASCISMPARRVVHSIAHHSRKSAGVAGSSANTDSTLGCSTRHLDVPGAAVCTGWAMALRTHRGSCLRSFAGPSHARAAGLESSSVRAAQASKLMRTLLPRSGHASAAD